MIIPDEFDIISILTEGEGGQWTVAVSGLGAISEQASKNNILFYFVQPGSRAGTSYEVEPLLTRLKLARITLSLPRLARSNSLGFIGQGPTI